VDFLSPDGEIGAPLQAAGFLAMVLAGALVLACPLISRARQTGPAGLASCLWRFDIALAVSLAGLAVLNLVDHAIRPLAGVYRPEVGDGGLVENLTVTLMLFPVAIFLGARLTGSGQTRHFGPTFMTLVSLVLIAAFGEEVSWGQHWFGLAVPEAIASTNLQSEINLHNYVRPGVMEAIYFAAGLVLLVLAANLRHVLQPAPQAPGFVALKALLVLAAILLCHHVFQELGELAVMAAAFLVWNRIDDGRLTLKPRWLRTLTAY